MNNNIINFYLMTNKLKDKIRNGWKEVDISSNRLESVAEHVYGCLMLAIAIDSEYDLKLDMYKVLKMISLHELEETIIKDYTIRDEISRKEKIRLGKEAVAQITDGMIKKEEIEELLDEFNNRKTKEAIFCFHIDKIECDFQAKVYDLKGDFKYENAIVDLKYYDNDAVQRVKNNAKNASDVWIEFDRSKYNDDEIFSNLLNDIQKLEELK